MTTITQSETNQGQCASYLLIMKTFQIKNNKSQKDYLPSFYFLSVCLFIFQRNFYSQATEQLSFSCYDPSYLHLNSTPPHLNHPPPNSPSIHPPIPPQTEAIKIRFRLVIYVYVVSLWLACFTLLRLPTAQQMLPHLPLPLMLDQRLWHTEGEGIVEAITIIPSVR